MSMEAEIFTAIRNALKGDSALLGYVQSDADNIRMSFARVAFDVPCVTYHRIQPVPDKQADKYGKFFFAIQINVFDVNSDTGLTNLQNITERIDTLLYDQPFTTTTYAVKRVQHSGWSDMETPYLKDDIPILQYFSDWTPQVHKKNT